jgi:SAM-dependent methyltransferase
MPKHKFFTTKKLDKIWADKTALERVLKIIKTEYGDTRGLRGLCHGSRNGFEQAFLEDKSRGLEVIGTDISETAREFRNSVVWDFHDVNPEWISYYDFVYSNSLDQSYAPHEAVQVWLSQLKPQGILLIEHTKMHGPQAASKMDPFGVRPELVPYLWFGAQISISHSVKKIEYGPGRLDICGFLERSKGNIVS